MSIDKKALADFLAKGGQRFTTIEDALATLGNRVAAVEGRAPGAVLPGAGGGLGGAEGFSFGKVIRGMALGGLDAAHAWEDATQERDIGIEARKRALSQGTDAAGGYIVPPEYMAELIPLLQSKTVVLEMGAQPWTGLTGSPVEVNRQDGGATAEWGIENEDFGHSEMSVDQQLMTPHMARGFTTMSRRVVTMSNPSIETAARNDLVGAVGRLVDIAALRGDGLGDSPVGLANTAGVTTTTLNAVPTLDDLKDAITQLEVDDALLDGLGWCMHPRIFGAISKIKDGDGNYIVERDVTKPRGSTLLGYPVRRTTAIPINLGGATDESEIYLGAWPQLVWGQWGGMIIEATTTGGESFRKHQVHVKVVTEVDFAVKQPLAFNILDEVRYAP